MIDIICVPPSYDLLTLREESLLAAADCIVLQSNQNTTAREIESTHKHTETLDDLFETADTFDELYAQGAKRIKAYSKCEKVVFAVLGNPYNNGFVQELQKTNAVQVNRCVDRAAEVLAIAQPILGAVNSYMAVDAQNISKVTIDTSQTLVVIGIDTELIASDVLLILEEYYGPDADCVLVKGGEADQSSIGSLMIQDQFAEGLSVVLKSVSVLDKNVYSFYDLVAIMEVLRSSDGCPWDRKQTHKSLRQYLIEEAYETAEAIDEKDIPALYDELGDVLLQVVFHAEIGRQSGTFNHLDVTTAICKKIIGRHPHIFADGDAKTAKKVTEKWEEIKRQEKGNQTFLSVLEDVPKTMGALMRAYKLQKKAAAIGFDWDKTAQAYEKVLEEQQEFEREMQQGNQDAAEQEAGDLIFSIVNVLRKMDMNPEVALTRTCEKFICRFEKMEEQAGDALYDMTLQELDKLWELAKQDNN